MLVEIEAGTRVLYKMTFDITLCDTDRVSRFEVGWEAAVEGVAAVVAEFEEALAEMFMNRKGELALLCDGKNILFPLNNPVEDLVVREVVILSEFDHSSFLLPLYRKAPAAPAPVNDVRALGALEELRNQSHELFKQVFAYAHRAGMHEGKSSPRATVFANEWEGCAFAADMFESLNRMRTMLQRLSQDKAVVEPELPAAAALRAAADRVVNMHAWIRQDLDAAGVNVKVAEPARRALVYRPGLTELEALEHALNVFTDWWKQVRERLSSLEEDEEEEPLY